MILWHILASILLFCGGFVSCALLSAHPNEKMGERITELEVECDKLRNSIMRGGV